MASTSATTSPTGTSFHTGARLAHGLPAENVPAHPPSLLLTVKRYPAATGTSLKSNAGANVKHLECAFQNGRLPGAPGRTGTSESATASSCMAALSNVRGSFASAAARDVAERFRTTTSSLLAVFFSPRLDVTVSRIL